MRKLPKFLKKYFWEVNFDELDPKKSHPSYIIHLHPYDFGHIKIMSFQTSIILTWKIATSFFIEELLAMTIPGIFSVPKIPNLKLEYD